MTADNSLAGQNAGASRVLALLAQIDRALGDTAADPLPLLARLLVPSLADLCIIYLSNGSGALHAAARAHADPLLEATLCQIDGIRSAAANDSSDPIAAGFQSGHLQLLASLTPEFSDRLASDPSQRELWRALELTSALILPLIADRSAAGVILLGLSDAQRQYSQSDLLLGSEVGSRAAAAISRRRLQQAHDHQRGRAERATRLIEHLEAVTVALARAMTVEQVTDAILVEGMPALDAVAGSVVLLEPDGCTLRVVRSIGYPPEVRPGADRFPVDAAAPLAEAIRGGAPIYLNDSEALAKRYPELAPGIGNAQRPASASAALPLATDGRPFGALGLSFPESCEFTNDDQAWLMTLARQCAQAVARARSYEQAVTELAQRREAEGALIERDHRLTLALGAARMGVWQFNVRDQTGTWDDRLLQLFGVKAHDPASHITSFLSQVHPDDRSLVASTIQSALHTERHYSVVYRIVRPDGEIRWVADHGRLQRGADGAPQYITGVLVDITEQKEAEADLARWAQIFAHAGWGIALLRADGSGFEAVNPAFARMHGYSQAQLLSGAITPSDLVLEDDQPRFAEALRRCLGEGHFSWDATHRRADGETFPVRVDCTAIHGASGAVEYHTANVLDLTDQRRTEAELRQAQKMEAVGQLAGGMAHEVNNMMTVILGFTEFLERTFRSDDPRQEDVVEIRRAAERAAGVTRQLLAFSRRQMLQPQLHEPNAVVEGMGPVLERAVGENVRVVTALEADLGAVKIDRGQIEQVLLNLALNARDAMPTGGEFLLQTSLVELPAGFSDAHPEVLVVPGPYIKLTVSDTGVGMSEETLARIFEPFYTTKAAGQGTGLGLSTVYGIIKQSGGYVWAYSEAGHGTTFKIYLPRYPSMAEPGQAAPRLPQVPKPTETILVVDDEIAVRGMMARALEAEGYRVLQAQEGGEALWLLNQHLDPVDLVVTDVVMPGMNGRELAERLAARAESGGDQPSPGVLFTSGYTDLEVVRRGLLDANAPFIQKPFRPEDLAKRVRHELNQRARRSTQRR